MWLLSCGSQPSALPFHFAVGDKLVVTFKVGDTDPTVRLPLPKGFNYNFTVDWGDGVEDVITVYDDPRLLHVYAQAGTYNVTITGQLSAWSFWQVPHSRDRLKTVGDLGDVEWKSLAGAFYACKELTSVAGGDVSFVEDMSYMFHRTTQVQPDTSSWDTGYVTSMRAMFDDARQANPDVSGWDTSKVIDMSGMFASTSQAQPQVGSWNTLKVEQMSGMFRNARVANPDVSRWSTAAVTDMSMMFADAVKAKPDVRQWDTAQVVSMYAMFKNATAAVPDMSSWDFSSVIAMGDMFKGVTLPVKNYSNMLTQAATTAGQNDVKLHAGEQSQYALVAEQARQSLVNMGWEITDGGLDRTTNAFSSRWQVAAGDIIELPLIDGYSYNFEVDWGDGSPIEGVTTKSVKHTYAQAGTYSVVISGKLEAWSFKANPRSKDKIISVSNLGMLGWKSLRGAFAGCSKLTTVAGGDTSAVTNMSYMFDGALLVKPQVADWDTSKVTDMSYMFRGAAQAEPSVSKWNVAAVTTMQEMFKGAVRAVPDMTAWNFAKVKQMDGMFSGVTLPTVNYDKMLLCLCATGDNSATAKKLGGGNAKYSDNDLSSNNLPCLKVDKCENDNGDVLSDGKAARAELEERSWQVSDGGLVGASEGGEFITRWHLPKGGKITLPLVRRQGMSYALEIEWCDGTRVSISGDQWQEDKISHTCPQPASSDFKDLPKVTITGSIGSGRWSCRDFVSEKRCEKLYAVDSLGDLQWKNLSGAFAFTNSLVVFKGGDTTAQVKDMSWMFWQAVRVKPEIGDLDVSNATNMMGMFHEAYSAEPDVSKWQTGKVTNMSWMFAKTRLANPDVSGWDTSSVKTMTRMFSDALKANPNVSSWQTSSVTDMSFMFFDAREAVPNVASWNTAKVTNIAGMFRKARKAKPDVSSWNTAKVTSMAGVFSDAELAKPDVSSWNTAKVTNMASMFRNAVVAEPDVSSWDTSAVIDMSSMFNGAVLANPDVSSWNVGNVKDMSHMFRNAAKAAPDVSAWNVASVENMSAMFMGAVKIPSVLNVAQWNFAKVANMASMFKGIKLPTATYSQMLTRISETTEQENVVLDGGLSKFNTPASIARAVLVDGKGWKITDAGEDSALLPIH